MQQDDSENIRYRHQIPSSSEIYKNEFNFLNKELQSEIISSAESRNPVVVTTSKIKTDSTSKLLGLNSSTRFSDDNFKESDSLKNVFIKPNEHLISKNVGQMRQSETAVSIAIQTIFPFIMAGLGMVSAGVFLDKVQHWKIFQKVPEIFILVPALLGLKGNLEMTLASRLSTYANSGYLDSFNKTWKIVWINIVTVEAQAIVVAFVASLLALSLSCFSTHEWKLSHAVILCAGSLLTGAIASALLAFVMVSVVLLSRKYKVNPDNVATPIAASLGDLVTLALLSNITQSLYPTVTDSSLSWIGPSIIFLLLAMAPILLYISYKNEISKQIVLHCWFPVMSAMTISSAGGFILNLTVSKYKDFAMFAPIINGVGGNLVAIQASRISTYLHTSGCLLGTLPKDTKACFATPWSAFSSDNIHAVGARVMLFLVVPGQIIFLFVLTMFHPGHVSITPLFVFLYLLFSALQVFVLLQVCNWLVLYLWVQGKDPDLSAIPYLTGLGDFLGTALLALGFSFLNSIGS